MLILAVTGALGAGKSRVAKVISNRANAPLFNADEIVHQLYRPKGKAVEKVANRFPCVKDSSGGIDRKRLSEHLADDPDGFKYLENIVHPLVAESRREFLELHRTSSTWMVVLDIPLLLEGDKKNKGNADVLIVVDAPIEVRRERLKQRSNMSAEKFDMLEERQLSIEDKRKQADYIIDNDGDWDAVRKQVGKILEEWEAR